METSTEMIEDKIGEIIQKIELKRQNQKNIEKI